MTKRRKSMKGNNSIIPKAQEETLTFDIIAFHFFHHNRKKLCKDGETGEEFEG